MGVLREELLDGRAVALAPMVPDGIGAALAALGARVEPMDGLVDGEDDEVGEWARAHGPLDALVYDAAASFGAGGLVAVQTTMQEAWRTIREVAVGALIDSPQPSKIVLLAPPPGAGTHADAVRSALENLARTLSVEWARHGVTAVAVGPGARTTDEELAELVSYLVSPAGEYFSGCLFELGTSELIQTS